MEIELRPGREFEDAMARLRVGPANIRKALNRSIKTATAPAERQLKEAIMGIESRGVLGGGGGQRSRFLTSKSKTGKLPTHTGLRKNIARGITRKITYSGTRGGVRIRADAKYLPADQRVLVVATNRGKVRHPVLGDRNIWVDQTFSPPGWFDRTLKLAGPKIVSDINMAAREAMRQLQ